MNRRLSVATRRDVEDMVHRWCDRGLITSTQGEKILAAEQEVLGGRTSGAAVTAEALGYVGGILVLVASLIIVSWYWSALGLAARSAVTGGAAATLVAAGAILPQRLGPARIRLRGVLWALSTAGFAVFLTVVGGEGFGWVDEDVALFASAGTAALASVLWVLRRGTLQHAAFLAALATLVGSAALYLPRDDGAAAGLAVWGLGLVWSVLAWDGLLAPRRAGLLLGAAALMVGALSTMQTDWGLALAGLTVLMLLAAAALVRDLPLLAVGGIGTFVVVPVIMQRLFPGALAAPVAVFGVGVLLIAAAVFLAVRGRPSPETARDRHPAPLWVVPAVAAAAAAVATVGVLLAGGLLG